MPLRYFTAGESHGKGLTAILEGMPAGIPVLKEDIDRELKRRQAGYGRGGRMKIESDAVEITSGVRHGRTLGSPVALWVENKDFRAWTDEMASQPLPGFVSAKSVTKPRPGHADLNGGIKYAQRDLRNILERASARETTARVAIGAICRKFLSEFGISVTGHVVNIGGERIPDARPGFDSIATAQENDPCRCIDASVSVKMRAKIDESKKTGNTVGGTFEIIFTGLPIGLGSHVQWDRKLDAKLAAAMLSIQAVKGVEFGLGFACADRFGSAVHDPIHYDADHKKFYHGRNHAGGIVGGMTNGEDIVVRGVMKPISTLYTPLDSVDIASKEPFAASIERSDTCAVPAASVIAENVLAITIADAMLEKFGGDSLGETRRNYESYLEQVRAY
jgi:chorismate synthase